MPLITFSIRGHLISSILFFQTSPLVAHLIYYSFMS